MGAGLDIKPDFLDQALLLPVIQNELQSPEIDIIVWHCQQLYGGPEQESAVYRITGECTGCATASSFSLILKVIRGTPDCSNPGGVRYWKREALAYQGSLLQNLPGGLVAPRCYGVTEKEDGSCWIWLEDLQDEIERHWPLDHYGVVARHLGQLNGAYLIGLPLPFESWLTHDWLRKYVEHGAPYVDFMRKNPHHPVVQKLYPGSTLTQMLILWDAHDRILNILDHLPQTFCHQDAFRRNLFAHHDKTFAIDWGYAGIAPLGAELVPLIGGTMAFNEIPQTRRNNSRKFVLKVT